MTRAQSIPPGPDALVSERIIPSPSGPLPARVYRPLGSEGQRLPVVVYFHGGGFVIGNVQQSDADCRRLAVGIGCVVVNVEYPLAPECTFPDIPRACYAAVHWVSAHADELNVDPARLAVAGDSAGGNLAAVTSLIARAQGGPAIAFQLLIYPVTDLSNFDTASYRENAEGLYLTRAHMRWFAGHYLRSTADASDPHASPLLATELSGLPAALVITAEFDPLRDEGEAYAARLREAGVPTQLSRHAGMIHGFFTMSSYLDAGKRATAEAIAALRGVFSQ